MTARRLGMTIIAGTSAAMLLLAGCSSNKATSGPRPCDEHCQSNMAAAQGSTLASAIPGVSTDDVSFLSLMRNDWPLATVKQVIQIGHDVCEQFSAGDTFAQIVRTATDAGVSGQREGTLIAAAVTFYCPQYESLTPAG